MNIACICSTKNEADVIEAFVRLNGRVCNSFFFVDESSDNTREIIDLLAREGYDLRYLTKSEGGYNQPGPTKAYLSSVKKLVNPDWIFLLDADEILIAPDKNKLLAEMKDIPSRTYLAAEWKTYVPTTLGFADSRSPLSECFALRKDQGEPYKKVSVPGRIVDDVITTPGNHTIRFLDGSTIREQVAKSYYLAHFPVRSAEQIVVKNLIATHNLRARVDTEKGEGIHVSPVFNTIRRRGYKLSLEDLRRLAINYGSGDESSKFVREDQLDFSASDELRTELRYSELARIDVVARLDSEIERLSMELKKRRNAARVDGLFLQAHARPVAKGGSPRTAGSANTPLSLPKNPHEVRSHVSRIRPD